MLTPKNTELTSAVSLSRSLTRVAQEFAGPLLLRVAVVGQHNVAEDVVPRPVLGEGRLEVVAHGRAAAVAALAAVSGPGHQHRLELDAQMASEGGRSEKAIDELAALVRRGIGEVVTQLGSGGNAAV